MGYEAGEPIRASTRLLFRDQELVQTVSGYDTMVTTENNSPSSTCGVVAAGVLLPLLFFLTATVVSLAWYWSSPPEEDEVPLQVPRIGSATANFSDTSTSLAITPSDVPWKYFYHVHWSDGREHAERKGRLTLERTPISDDIDVGDRPELVDLLGLNGTHVMRFKDEFLQGDFHRQPAEILAGDSTGQLIVSQGGDCCVLGTWGAGTFAPMTLPEMAFVPVPNLSEVDWESRRLIRIATVKPNASVPDPLTLPPADPSTREGTSWFLPYYAGGLQDRLANLSAVESFVERTRKFHIEQMNDDSILLSYELRFPQLGTQTTALGLLGQGQVVIDRRLGQVTDHRLRGYLTNRLRSDRNKLFFDIELRLLRSTQANMFPVMELATRPTEPSLDPIAGEGEARYEWTRQVSAPLIDLPPNISPDGEFLLVPAPTAVYVVNRQGPGLRPFKCVLNWPSTPIWAPNARAFALMHSDPVEKHFLSVHTRTDNGDWQERYFPLDDPTMRDPWVVSLDAPEGYLVLATKGELRLYGLSDLDLKWKVDTTAFSDLVGIHCDEERIRLVYADALAEVDMGTGTLKTIKSLSDPNDRPIQRGDRSPIPPIFSHDGEYAWILTAAGIRRFNMADGTSEPMFERYPNVLSIAVQHHLNRIVLLTETHLIMANLETGEEIERFISPRVLSNQSTMQVTSDGSLVLLTPHAYANEFYMLKTN